MDFVPAKDIYTTVYKFSKHKHIPHIEEDNIKYYIYNKDYLSGTGTIYLNILPQSTGVPHIFKDKFNKYWSLIYMPTYIKKQVCYEIIDYSTPIYSKYGEHIDYERYFIYSEQIHNILTEIESSK